MMILLKVYGLNQQVEHKVREKNIQIKNLIEIRVLVGKTVAETRVEKTMAEAQVEKKVEKFLVKRTVDNLMM